MRNFHRPQKYRQILWGSQLSSIRHQGVGFRTSRQIAPRSHDGLPWRPLNFFHQESRQRHSEGAAIRPHDLRSHRYQAREHLGNMFGG